MARAAASAALLNKELDSLSKDSVRTRRSLSDIDQPTQNFGRTAGLASREVDKLSGRMRIFADAAAILGPGIVSIGAVGIPAIAGIAAQLGFAAVGAGTAVLAFQGVGDALKAVNKAALEPTAQNLEAARIAMEAITPSAQAFVAQIRDMVPELKNLRNVAADGLFPGLTRGLIEVEGALPRVEGIISAVATELGEIAADAGGSLASQRWAPFLEFIADEAPEALADMAKAAGNTAHAVAELWMATDPLNDDFSQWLVDATADIDRWATGLSKTQGFADFIAYIEKTGPKVADALGAIANAAVQILQAAAPLGGPVLDGIKALADVVASLANSDLGTPLFTAVAALALFNRSLVITGAIQGKTFGGPAIAAVRGYGSTVRGLSADMALLSRQSKLVTLPTKGFIGPLTQAQTALGRVKASAATLGKSAAVLGGLAIASTGAADGLGLTNTASLALMGTLTGQPWGVAIGGAAGAVIDLTHANDDLETAIKRVNDAAKAGDFSAMEEGIKRIKKELADLGSNDGVGDFVSDTVKRAGSAFTHPFSAFGSRASEAEGRNAIAAGKAAAAAARGASAQELLARGFHATAEGADKAAQSTADFRDSINKLNAVLTGRASFRDFEQALDDFTKRSADRAKIMGEIAEQQAKITNPKSTKSERQAAKDRIKDLREQADLLKNSLDIGTQQGRDTQELLDNIASTALKVAENLQGADRVGFLDAARKQFIKAATDAGMAKDAAKALADEVLGLDNVKGTPKIVIDADGAIHILDDIQQRLRQFKDKTIRVKVLTNLTQANSTIPQVLDAQAQADGGTVYGPRAPYRDKVLTYLAPGEEVISNRFGQADRYRDVLKAINARRYADGGTVQPFGGTSSFGAAIDYDRLALAMSSVRPLYGDVHVSGDPTTWRRQMEQDKRAAGIGGVPA